MYLSEYSAKPLNRPIVFGSYDSDLEFKVAPSEDDKLLVEVKVKQEAAQVIIEPNQIDKMAEWLRDEAIRFVPEDWFSLPSFSSKLFGCIWGALLIAGLAIEGAVLWILSGGNMSKWRHKSHTLKLLDKIFEWRQKRSSR